MKKRQAKPSSISSKLMFLVTNSGDYTRQVQSATQRQTETEQTDKIEAQGPRHWRAPSLLPTVVHSSVSAVRPRRGEQIRMKFGH
mmetsp:Transcript_27548/g.41653  ORF Transcript_27548/g.41653 Transcript_27548/m.41653 type:complete len:85 (-) Transcript_27548:216-470(-)